MQKSLVVENVRSLIAAFQTTRYYFRVSLVVINTRYLDCYTSWAIRSSIRESILRTPHFPLPYPQNTDPCVTSSSSFFFPYSTSVNPQTAPSPFHNLPKRKAHSINHSKKRTPPPSPPLRSRRNAFWSKHRLHSAPPYSSILPIPAVGTGIFSPNRSSRGGACR